MTLLTLIKKGGLSRVATATHATIATLEADQCITVAEVATVAVAVNPNQQLEPKRKTVIPELSKDEESTIRAWLAHIKETNPDTINDVLDKCRNNPNTRRYVLRRTEELPVMV